MEKLKVAVICGGKTAFQTIQFLHLEGNLVGVAIGGSEKDSIQQLSEFGKATNLPFTQIASAKDQHKLIEWIHNVQADYIYVINFPYYFTEETLKALPEKWFNFHMGPLPRYRGAMPIFEVIKAGENETAIAVHKIIADIDEGPLVFQESVQLDVNETFGSLALKMRNRVCLVAQNLTQMLTFGTNLPLIAQDENDAEYFPMPDLEETRVIWEYMSAKEIVHLSNACNPWNGGADVFFKGKQFKIVYATYEVEEHNCVSGTVISIQPQLVQVACAKNTLLNISIVSTDAGIVPADRLTGIQLEPGVILLSEIT